jgi:hypothetical protein
MMTVALTRRNHLEALDRCHRLGAVACSIVLRTARKAIEEMTGHGATNSNTLANLPLTRSASRATDQIRAGDQSQDRQDLDVPFLLQQRAEQVIE